MPKKICEVEVEEKNGGRKNTHHAIIDLFARTARSVGRRHLRPLHSFVRLILPHGCQISLPNCPLTLILLGPSNPSATGSPSFRPFQPFLSATPCPTAILTKDPALTQILDKNK